MNLIAPATYPGQTSSMLEAHAAREEIDVLAVAGRLWRRKYLILIVTALLAIAPAVVIFNLTARYRAEAQVMVDDRKVQIVSLPDVLSAHSTAEDTVLTEVQVLTSRDLAKSIVRELGLNNDPEFNTSKRPLSRIQTLARRVRQAVGELPFMPDLQTPAESNVAMETRVVDTFLDKLSVAPLGRSRVIRIVFESESPATAARVVNTIAQRYLQNQIRVKADAATRATEWLESHLKELQEKAEASRLAKERYRRQVGLLQSGKDSTLTVQHAAELNRQLAEARARESAAEARLGNAMTAVASRGAAANLSEIVQSPEIQALRQQQASLRRRVADLETTFGPKYYLIERIEAESKTLDETIAHESRRIIEGLAADVTREKANVVRLTALFKQSEDLVGKGNEAEAKLATLDRELVANDSVYMMFLDRVKQLSLQQGSLQPDSQVVTLADPPAKPFFPQRGMLLSLTVLTCGLISSFVALALDGRNSTLNDLNQVQSALGSRLLGLVPLARELKRGREVPQLLSDEGPLSAFTEAIRSLHARLLLAAVDQPKVLMFASSLSGEGKTATAMAFAALMASIGRKVVLIDCDTRRPSVHQGLGLSLVPGLTDYLSDESLENVVRTAGTPLLSVITAGDPVSHPAALLASDRMRDLLSRLKNEYELVILDSAPVLEVPDALVLAGLVDKIVYLVQWARTPQAAAERGLQLLREAGADIAGTMLSMVNTGEATMHASARTYYRKAERRYRVA